jgi:REP element-mobilizing transposase RayT
MQYNPKIHHRRSIRLKGYDYSAAGLYFITSCCQEMKCRFGKIEKNEMLLNEFGMIAYNEWIKLPERFPNFTLDVFQIMPNHMHGIISVGAGFTPAQTPAQNDHTCENRAGVREYGAGVNPAPTIGDIVGAYKSLVSNECLKIYKSRNEIMGRIWQRNYYEHIIRNESSYNTISEYIINNPQQWDKDNFYR